MKSIAIITLLLVAFITACSDKSGSGTIAGNSNSQGYNEQGATARSASNTGGGGGGGQLDNAPVAAQQISLTDAQQTQEAPTARDRKIIRNAKLNLEADSPEESQQKIATLAQQNGALSSNRSRAVAMLTWHAIRSR